MASPRSFISKLAKYAPNSLITEEQGVISYFDSKDGFMLVVEDGTEVIQGINFKVRRGIENTRHSYFVTTLILDEDSIKANTANMQLVGTYSMINDDILKLQEEIIAIKNEHSKIDFICATRKSIITELFCENDEAKNYFLNVARILDQNPTFRDKDIDYPEATSSAPTEKSSTKLNLKIQAEKDRDILINDIQDLIYALHFEEGPDKEPSKMENPSLFFVKVITEILLSEPKWKQIKVSNGPISDAMHEVLKSAISALKTLNPHALSDALREHSGQYDSVKTAFGGTLSLAGGGYVSFAKAMGTVTNQPGYLVDKILLRVKNVMKILCVSDVDQANGQSQTIRLRK